MVATPEWLARRGGNLRAGNPGYSLFVDVAGAPLYKLVIAPAGGSFVGHVTETITGRLVGDQASGATKEAAARAALEVLRKELGW